MRGIAAQALLDRGWDKVNLEVSGPRGGDGYKLDILAACVEKVAGPR